MFWTDIVWITVCVSGIIALVASVLVAAKSKDSCRMKYSVISAVCVFVAGLSWRTNIGVMRLVFAIFMLLHTTIFWVSSYFAAELVKKSRRINIITALSFITYLAAYVFLPDFHFYGQDYMFFGMVHSDILSEVCTPIAIVAFLCNVILVIWQLFEIKVIKKTEN